MNTYILEAKRNLESDIIVSPNILKKLKSLVIFSKIRKDAIFRFSDYSTK